VRPLDHPLWTAIGAGVAGAVIAAVLLATGFLDRAGPPPPPPPTPGAASAFLTAWRAHLLGSWAVVQVEQRTFPSGSSVSFDIRSAQNPPDSLETEGGTASGRQGSTQFACATSPRTGRLLCRRVQSETTWEQYVDSYMAAVRAQISGPTALYGVAETGHGCFVFEAIVPPAHLPVLFGRSARYCIDATTGALISSTVDVVGAVDTLSTIDLHSPATASDLKLPAGATFGS
jgi:hypothetical protein